MINQQIYELELSLLTPEVRQSPEKLAPLLADDFIEFGQSGKIYSKNDILTDLPLEAPVPYLVENFSTIQLADQVILATYKLRVDSATSLRSSIWKLNGEVWQLIFHQGTKCSLD